MPLTWITGTGKYIYRNLLIRQQFTNYTIVYRTEKNASQWSKDKIDELLNGLEINDIIGNIHYNMLRLESFTSHVSYVLGNCVITEIEKMEGEASANNRKAKLIFFFEWTLHLKWSVMNDESHTVVLPYS